MRIKLLVLIIFILSSGELFSQRANTPGAVGRANSTILVEDINLSARNGLLLPRFSDSTEANTYTLKDTLGNVFYNYATQSIWVRTYDSGKKWEEIGGGGGAGTVTSVGITGSDFSISGSPVTTSGDISLTLATVNGNVGSFGSATQAGTFTVNGKGLITAASNTTITPAVGSITGLGTGVATALAVNIGTAGSFVVNGGALGTPSSGVATNLTGTATALNIGGNAATATILQTARNIQGVSFNGSAAIDIINGTGFVKATGTTLSYDNSTYVTGNIYTDDGTIDDATRTVELGGSELSFTEAGNSLLYMADGQSTLRAFNPTDNDNISSSTFVSGATSGTFAVLTSFNNLAKYSQISGLADVDSSIINYTSDKHVFFGDIVLQDLAGNGAGVVAVDNNGLLSWSAAGGGTTIYTGDGTIDDATRTVTISAGNSLIWDGGAGSSITSTADSHTFNAGGEQNGFISLTGSSIRSFEGTDDDNISVLSVSSDDEETAFNLSSSFNGGAQSASIQGISDVSSSELNYFADLHTITGAVSIVGVTTLTGNLLAVADNTYDIGDATNSFQDIFSRTLVLDGSTSGTVTLASDAVSKSLRATTLTGEGVVWNTSFGIQQTAFTLSDVNTDQPAFAAAFDTWTLQGSTLYEFEGYLDITTGTNSHSVAFGFALGGGASINWIKYQASTFAGTINTNVTGVRYISVNQSTQTVLNAAGGNARQYHYIKGFVSVNAAGTFVPTITFSLAPGGTNEMNIGSYMKFTPVGINSTATVGPAS